MAGHNETIILRKVRVNYVNGLFEARQFKGQGKHRYSAAFIISDDANKKLIDDTIEALGQGAFGKEWLKFKAKWENDSRYIFLVKDNVDYPEGCWVASVNRGMDRGRVKVVSRDPSIELLNDGTLTSGDFVNVKINVWAQTKDNPGIRGELESVQFVGKGDPFAGAAREATAEGFECIEDAEDGVM